MELQNLSQISRHESIAVLIRKAVQRGMALSQLRDSGQWWGLALSQLRDSGQWWGVAWLS